MGRRVQKWICSLLAFAIVASVALPACALETGPEEPREEAAPVAETLQQTLPQETAEAPQPEETQPEETEAAEPSQPEPGETPEEAPEDPESEPEADSAVRQMPCYYQTDYPGVLYGSGTIPTSGCGITCLAMLATYLTGHTYYPDELAGYFGGYVGNNMERLEYASDQLRLPWEKAENWHKALAALQEGKYLIALMNRRSAFTDGQHFILITGLTEDGRVLVRDPSRPNYDKWELKEGFENGFHPTTISNGYSGAWIYDPALMPDEPFIYQEEKVEVECRYPGLELSDEDWNLLARMVWIEAQGEPVDGQQAVAEVVLNRVAADNFPDSVRGVVYAQDQFRSTKHLGTAEPTQTQYEAVERALNGPYVLPKDVVFFATYKVNSGVWGKIGGHYFCYQWDMEPYEVQQTEPEEPDESAE